MGGEAHVVRLLPADRDTARKLFALIEVVFEADPQLLSDAYIDQLLSRPDFWALVAFEGQQVVGGLIAHTLMMTAAERSEVFVYDIAVIPDQQRLGHGRRLVQELRALANQRGIDTVFVAADDEDIHALDFYRALGATPSPVTMFEFGPR